MLDFYLVPYFTNFAVENVNEAFVYVTDLKRSYDKIRRNHENCQRGGRVCVCVCVGGGGGGFERTKIISL